MKRARLLLLAMIMAALVVLVPGMARAAAPDVVYSSHVQNIGWMDEVANGAMSGTSGRAYRMEALTIRLAGVEGSISYRAHVQNVGWQDWVADGDVAGTSGKALRVEAIQIKLDGAVASRYNVTYRAHVQNVGWTKWVSNGETAGTTGRALRVEAIEIRLENKNGFDAVDGSLVTYRTHVQTIGWQKPVSDGSMGGTTGKSYRVEALQVVLGEGIDGGIRYRSHVQNIGWQDWASDGAVSGTSGKAYRVEAMQMELTGNAALSYDVYYRVHVQDIGWMSWAKNGATAGTVGYAKRVEAVEIAVVAKGEAAPNNSDAKVPFASVDEVGVVYEAHLENDGWSRGEVRDGATAGSAEDSLQVEAIRAHLEKTDVNGSILYSVKTGQRDWSAWSADGEVAGTTGKSQAINAIAFKLDGALPKYFDIYYRAYINGYGWLGWASNGASAGTASTELSLDAYEVRIIKKGSAAPGSSIRAYIKGALIYLDAGHGPSGGHYDSGALGSGYTEAVETKNLVNKIANYARTMYGVEVYSNVDCDVDFRQRQAHAASVGATAFVSIHFNSSVGSGASGFESYIYDNFGGQFSGSAAPGSSEIRDIMHAKLRASLGIKGLSDRGKLLDAFAVTSGAKTGIPATLLEICFISNPGDMRIYKANEDNVAKALAQGLSEIYVSQGGAPINRSDFKPVAPSSPDAVPDAKQADAAVSESEPIMGKSKASRSAMINLYKAKGISYPSEVYAEKGAATIEEYVDTLIDVADSEGVRADVVFCQAMLETSWLRFGGDVKAEQCNFAGIGAVGNGEPGNSFASVREGLLAQVQHLKGYASTDPLNNECVDPRFKYLSAKRGSAPTVDGLTGTWAMSSWYADSITSMLNELGSFK